MDALKLTNSEFFVYGKDSPADLEKFYYDLTFVLGATYFKSVSIEFTISVGWSYVAAYGNFSRAGHFIRFNSHWL